MGKFCRHHDVFVTLDAEIVTLPTKQTNVGRAVGSMAARTLAFLDWPMDTFLQGQVGVALIAELRPGSLRAEQPFLLLMIPAGGNMAWFALPRVDGAVKRRADQLTGMAFAAFLTCHGICCHPVGNCEMKQHQCGGQGANEKRDSFHNKPL